MLHFGLLYGRYAAALSLVLPYLPSLSWRKFVTFRLTDIDDLIANAAGAALGCLLAALVLKHCKIPPAAGRISDTVACAALLSATAAVMMTVQPYAASFLWAVFL